jgi:chemotaxis protein MotB
MKLLTKIATGVVTATLLTGCGITTEVHQAVIKDLDQCRVDLAYCKKTRADDADFQRQVRTDLESQNATLKQENESTRKDLLAYRGKSEAELVSCVDARHKLETDLETIRQLHNACEAELNQKKANLQELADKTARFKDKLQSEIAARNVEIENLRGQLSVRVLDKILFRSGSAVILPEGQKVLAKLADLLATEDDIVRVEGHTDSVPIGAALKEKYPSNWELSGARAASVVRYFEQDHKVDPTRMEAVGFSMYRPVATGDSPEELQRNRRVEIVLLPPRKLDAK